MSLSEPKKILFVSPFSESVSGADESLFLAIANLDAKRYRPYVMVPPDSKYVDRYRLAGAEVVFWNLSRMRRKWSPLFWLNYLISLRNEIRLLPLYLLGKEIDLVHINMHVALGPAIAAKKIGLPVVIHYRAKTNDRPKFFFNWFLPKVAKYADSILCISRQVADHFERRNLSQNVTVLYNPIEITRFESPHATTSSAKVILFVGRVTPQKQIDIFLKSLRILISKGELVKGLVVGDAAEEDLSYLFRLKDIAKDLPVEWISGRKDVETFFSKGDVFAFPAIHEGFGRVLVEAMASGIPIVGVNSGATPELLQDGKWGVLTPPKDPEEFAKGIQKALHDPEWRGKALEAKKYAKECFSVTSHVNKLMDTYDRLLR